LTSAIILAVVAFLSTTILHLGVLKWCSGGMARIPMRISARTVAIMCLLFAAHMLQIGIYAGIFAFAERGLALGSFTGTPLNTPLDYYYFSAVSYTSLGFGDVLPTRHLRFLTGVEALNGLLLIAWSASFLYTIMDRLWIWHPCVGPDGPPRDMSGRGPAPKRQQDDTGKQD